MEYLHSINLKTDVRNNNYGLAKGYIHTIKNDNVG